MLWYATVDAADNMHRRELLTASEVVVRAVCTSGDADMPLVAGSQHHHPPQTKVKAK